MGYEARNPVSQKESRVLCFFYPVRDWERCATHIHQGAKRRVDFTLDRQTFSISNGVRQKSTGDLSKIPDIKAGLGSR